MVLLSVVLEISQLVEGVARAALPPTGCCCWGRDRIIEDTEGTCITLLLLKLEGGGGALLMGLAPAPAAEEKAGTGAGPGGPGLILFVII
jgi:hypothetical protein